MFKKGTPSQCIIQCNRYMWAMEDVMGNIGERSQKKRKKKLQRQMLPRTSVVLLLLVIVAELPFTLCRHPTLCLHHVLYFIWASLETLGGIEPLKVGVRVHPGSVEVANRVVTLGHSIGHTGICNHV